MQCPLLSLPLVFRTSRDTIPAAVPYLRAESERVEQWSGRLGSKRAPRIGLVWSGGAAHDNDRNRSIPLTRLGRLLALPFEWLCLQKEFREEDREALGKCGTLRHFEDAIENFSDTAALIECCDLVISVDTSVAHLSGALGKRVWILLPHRPDWRWLEEGDGSPWYPTARLYRQPRVADWDIVIERVAEALERGFAEDPTALPSRSDAVRVLGC
jgi:hypothetical protein